MLDVSIRTGGGTLLKPRIIFVDDDKLVQRSTQILLEQVYGTDLNFTPEYFCHPQMAVNSIRRNPFDVCAVFLDEQIWESAESKISGSDFIQEIKRISHYIKVVMVSGDMSPETLAHWIKARADNYLYKAEDDARKITIFIDDAVSQFSAKFGHLFGQRHRNRFLVPECLKKIGLVSTSPKMESIVTDVLEKIATSPLEPIVMIIGASGTGKELIAKAIHEASRRREKEFGVVDCTHFKDSDIVGVELFGSEKGAFTGAENKAGIFELTDGGTVFIDEIHHLGLKAQGMLLRFLQDQTLKRIGGKLLKKVNCRIIFAGQPVFEEMVQRGEFLPDLAFRIRQVVLNLPNLKERDNDIEVLAHHFLENANEVTKRDQRLHPDSIDLLRSHSWPGNVRELKAAIERVCALVHDTVILPHHFLNAGKLVVDRDQAFVPGQTTIKKLKEAQRTEMIALVIKTFQGCDCNLSVTAKMLDIPRSSLRELCGSLGISEVMMVDSKVPEKRDKSHLKERLEKYLRVIFTIREPTDFLAN
jgi:DNA-binding NtrC family response regulator